MELVQGQTLRQLLQDGPLTPRRALQIAAPIADGLAKAHDAGIVHRDLKPENLMVSHDGFAKILDFGLAKLVGTADAAVLPTMTAKATWPGSVMGTVGYMSPEQASGTTADSRSDQFSFGLVLFEMLTGQRAFARPTTAETLSAIIRDDAPPLAQLNPAIPAPVRWIVDRCLAKNPAERYASTRDLARDLASARDHFSELTGSGASAVSAAAPVARVKRRELVAWLLVAMLGIAALALFLRPGAEADSRSRPHGPLHDRAPERRQFHVEHRTPTICGVARRAPSGVHGHRRRQATRALPPLVRFARVAADSRDRRRVWRVLVAGQSRRWVLYSGPAETSGHLRWRCDHDLRGALRRRRDVES